MTATLADLVATFERLWPLSGADDWDAPGLVVGSPSSGVDRVLLSVDATVSVLGEASGFDLLLTHHPALLRGVNTLSSTTAKGMLVEKAIRQGTAIYAAHTNADIVQHGVSDTLAKALGLNAVRPLVITGDTETGASKGHGRFGFVEGDSTLGDLARRLAELLPATAQGVRVAGEYVKPVERVALCAGAGDAFLEAALEQQADVYITSDLRHHPVQEALESAAAMGRDFALIDISHWAAEWLWLEVAASQLRAAHPSVVFEVSDLRTDPWEFVITQ